MFATYDFFQKICTQHFSDETVDSHFSTVAYCTNLDTIPGLQHELYYFSRYGAVHLIFSLSQ